MNKTGVLFPKVEPLISIITVVFNGQKYLEQTYKNIEYIIIDGGSTDGTLDIIRKYEDYIDCWISEKDAGIYDAMNKGILLASGVTINLLNCGDSLLSDHVASVANVENLEDSVVYSDYFTVSTEGHVIRKKETVVSPETGMSICHQTMFIGKNIYKDYGLYDCKYKLASDYDYFIRMLLHNIKFIKINSVGVNFLFGDGATERNMWLSFSEAVSICKKHYGFFSKEHFILIGSYFEGWIASKVKSLLYLLIPIESADKLIHILKKIKKSR
jgi:glycosyltransferase involved in cell wall biosynthesis